MVRAFDIFINDITLTNNPNVIAQIIIPKAKYALTQRILSPEEYNYIYTLADQKAFMLLGGTKTFGKRRRVILA